MDATYTTKTVDCFVGSGNAGWASGLPSGNTAGSGGSGRSGARSCGNWRFVGHTAAAAFFRVVQSDS